MVRLPFGLINVAEYRNGGVVFCTNDDNDEIVEEGFGILNKPVYAMFLQVR